MALELGAPAMVYPKHLPANQGVEQAGLAALELADHRDLQPKGLEAAGCFGGLVGDLGHTQKLGRLSQSGRHSSECRVDRAGGLDTCLHLHLPVPRRRLQGQEPSAGRRSQRAPSLGRATHNPSTQVGRRGQVAAVGLAGQAARPQDGGEPISLPGNDLGWVPTLREVLILLAYARHRRSCLPPSIPKRIWPTC